MLYFPKMRYLFGFRLFGNAHSIFRSQFCTILHSKVDRFSMNFSCRLVFPIIFFLSNAFFASTAYVDVPYSEKLV